MFLPKLNQSIAITNSTQNEDFTNNIYKTYKKQILPTLNYYPMEIYPRPISRGTYIKKEYQERNELLLEIKEQNAKLKYLFNTIRQQSQLEQEKIINTLKELKLNNERTEEKLSQNNDVLQEIKRQLKDMNRVRAYKKKYHWQKTIPSFIKIYKFYKNCMYLAYNRSKRDRMIRHRRLNQENDYVSIRKWVFGLENELLISLEYMKKQGKTEKFFLFNDINDMKSYIKQPIYYKDNEIIMYLLKIFMKNLIEKASSLSDIPYKIQELLYSYIRERVYYSKSFLSTYEINRLSFNFFGETIKNTKSAMGMLLSLLVISKSVIHYGLFKVDPKESNSFFEGDLTEGSIQILKVFSSILHYITRETFKNKPMMMRMRSNLLNYYRNYKIYVPDVEEEVNEFSDIPYSDIDEYYTNMIDEDISYYYCLVHREFVEEYKKSLYNWSVLLSNQLKRKYGKKKIEVFKKEEEAEED